MNRYSKLTSIYKIAVNKEQKDLGEEFLNSGKFSAENKNKIFAIAAQWWRAFNGTSVYENWKFLQNNLRDLKDVIEFIKKNKDSVERADSNHENNSVKMLSGIYPEFKDKFLDFNERFLAWLVSRYGENSKYENLHPIEQAIPTLEKYQAKARDLRQKFDSNEKYKNLFNSLESGAKNPSDIMKLSVNDMEAAIALAERPKDLHTVLSDDYEPKRFLGQFGPWKLWLPEGVSDSIAIAKYNNYSMLPDTEWCTGRTFGHNLFYLYTASNTFLFYLIKDGATKDNLLDYQSIGVDGDILYNGDGSETVDGDNNGMYEDDHRRLFGDYFEEIYSAIYREVNNLNGIHPVEDKVKKAALGDREAYEELTRVGDPDTKYDIERKISNKRVDIAEETSNQELIELFYNDENIDVRRAIVRNPNIPTEMLENIYRNAPLETKQHLVDNYKIFLPENIDILNGLASLNFGSRDQTDMASANYNPNVSTQQIGIANNIRFAIARNNQTPETIIQLFFRNEDDHALSGYITDNTNYIEKSENIFSFISEDYKSHRNEFANRILTLMASSELTSEELLEKIYNLARADISDYDFLRNKVTPTSILASIYDGVAANDLNKMREISRHPNISTKLLSRMRDDKSILWQYETAYSIDTPVEKLEELSNSKHLEVLEALSKNPMANTEVIFNNLIKYVKIKKQVAFRDDLPESILDALSKDKDIDVRRIIAKKRNIGREVALHLSKDWDEMVRVNIYDNPSTPIDIVLYLSKEFYSSSRLAWTGSRRVAEYNLGNEAFKIIDDLYRHQRDLLNDGIDINEEVGGDGKSEDKVDRLAKRIAEAGSIVFYDADLTDLDLTEKYSRVWATNFINKNKDLENLNRNKRLALSLAKEIVQDTGEEGIMEEEEDMVIDKMSNLIVWLSKSGHKKEAADILSLYKEATLKIKMSPLEIAVALGLLSEKALIGDDEKETKSKKKEKKEKDVIEDLLKELREFDLEKEAAKKKKKKKKSKKKKRTPTKPDLWQRAIAAAKRKFDVYPCVPVETSYALTREGWRTYSELRIGDEIVSYNRDLDCLQWDEILNLNFFENAPTMRMYKSATCFDFICTEDHNWVIKNKSKKSSKRYKYEDQLVPARSITKNMNIITSARMEDSEGIPLNSFRKREWSWVEKVLAMSNQQREAWLAAAIVYDGHENNYSQLHKRASYGFSQKNDDHAEATEICAALLGYNVSFKKHKKYNPDISSYTFIDRQTHGTQNVIKEPADNCDVWCPETKNGTWLMKQGRMISITGNSAYANGWALQWYKKKGGGWRGPKPKK